MSHIYVQITVVDAEGIVEKQIVRDFSKYNYNSQLRDDFAELANKIIPPDED